MLNGNVDLVIIDDSAAKGYMQLKPIKIIHIIETGESYGIAMKKGSAYKAPVDQHLAEILASNQWLELIKKYF